jgi:membrane protease YdiL (CAAX protease family)
MSDAITTEPAEAPPPSDPPTVDNPTTVPWTGVEIVLLVILVLILWPSVLSELLRWTGFFGWYYPAETPGVKERQSLWLRALEFPFQAATIPLFLALLHGVSPAALGLSRHRLGRNVLTGVFSAAILAPLVLGFHWAIVWFTTHGLGIKEEKHPLIEMTKWNLTPIEWGLWVFAAVVAAPVIEELLFRGLIQPWARKANWGGAACFGFAAVLAVALRNKEIAAAAQLARESGWDAAPVVLNALAPLLFVLALVPLLLLAMNLSRDNAISAVLGTSLLFAMVHASVWPSPVALLILALGLGWMRDRTGSLVGPIVLHSLFNGVSCAMVLFGLA